MPQTPLAASNQERIVELAAKNRLPAIYVQGSFVVSGGLMSYGADRTERYKRVAVFVDKILKGTKPADIPVEQPTVSMRAVARRSPKHSRSTASIVAAFRSRPLTECMAALPTEKSY